MVAHLINITFHGLGTPARDLTEGERAVWVSTRSFHEILDAVQRSPSVRITFDDGNDSDHAIALPALLERNLRATFFVLGARVDSPGFLDRGAIRDLVRAGMRIGVHGMDHRPWTRLAPEATEREMSESRRLLEDVVEGSIDEASCPFGAYDSRVLRELRARRYRRVFTSDRLPAREPDWFQPRFTVHTDDDATSIGRLIHDRPSLDRWVRRAKVFLKKRRR
jgi:peptidoglycan/xylan/chitin deacetylase (PgdA/CDA1 family)